MTPKAQLKRLIPGAHAFREADGGWRILGPDRAPLFPDHPGCLTASDAWRVALKQRLKPRYRNL